MFARAGFANGNIEPYDFADIDRTVAAGLSLAGKQWGRPDDTFGFAGVVNGITKIHEQFFNAGGLGILVGDGMLPHPGPEQIIETYYALPVSFFKLTLDYQFIVNPGYNEDRGPVSVVSARAARAVLIHRLWNSCPPSRLCIIRHDYSTRRQSRGRLAAASCGVAMRGRIFLGVALAVLGQGARAADISLPVKAPPQKAASIGTSYDWTGFYVGAHFGYAGGSSNWSAVPPLNGSLDFYKSFDVFKGTGSYFAGLQAGYNYLLPSRLLLGIEADVSFPNTVGGTALFSSPATGLASYAEQVEMSGTVRGRFGYAPGDWLFYATGGFAWSLRPVHPQPDRRRARRRHGDARFGGELIHGAAGRRRGRRRRRSGADAELGGAA